MFPAWVHTLVERYELGRCSISKYARSVERALDRRALAALPDWGARTLA